MRGWHTVWQGALSDPVYCLMDLAAARFSSGFRPECAGEDAAYNFAATQRRRTGRPFYKIKTLLTSLLSHVCVHCARGERPEGQRC